MFLTVAGVGVGAFLTIGGMLSSQLHWSLTGLVAVALVWASRRWIQRHGQCDPAERTVHALSQIGPPPDEARAQELMALLKQWEALEQKRGSPEFDPWTLQILRNDIRNVVESDPALEALFTNLQKAA